MRLSAFLVVVVALTLADSVEAAELQVGGQVGASYQWYDGFFASSFLASVHFGFDFNQRHRFGGQAVGLFRDGQGATAELGGFALMFIYRYRTRWLPKVAEPYFEFGLGPAIVAAQAFDGLLVLSGVFGMRFDLGPVALMANTGVWTWFVFSNAFAVAPVLAIGLEF